MTAQPRETAIVAIGRNEGERLRQCLQSLPAEAATIVYVDSGSTDGSIELAEGHGAEVVTLDPNRPFSAARARNEGLRRARELNPSAKYVQFLDGDCALDENWLSAAHEPLHRADNLAVVCGRRREIMPQASIYNRLCDLEWDTPVGEAKACGGDSLMRIAALDQVGGFDPSVVAGEEPELCFRLRQHGWRIQRLDAEMAYHDAAMTRFGDWWRRAKRSGHAYGQGLAMHGRSSERFCLRPTLSIWLWAGVLPIAIFLLGLLVTPWAFLLALISPLQALRIAFKQRQRGRSWSDGLLYGTFCMIGKFAQLQGQIQWWWRYILGRQPKLIEYKAPAASAP